MKKIELQDFYNSYSLQGMIKDNWPYLTNEKTISKKSNILITKDDYNSFMFYFITNGTKVGALQVVHNPSKGVSIASNIFVREDYRRQGISGKLIKQAYTKFPNMEFSNDRNDMSIGMVEKYQK